MGHQAHSHFSKLGLRPSEEVGGGELPLVLPPLFHEDGGATGGHSAHVAVQQMGMWGFPWDKNNLNVTLPYGNHQISWCWCVLAFVEGNFDKTMEIEWLKQQTHIWLGFQWDYHVKMWEYSSHGSGSGFLSKQGGCKTSHHEHVFCGWIGIEPRPKDKNLPQEMWEMSQNLVLDNKNWSEGYRTLQRPNLLTFVLHVNGAGLSEMRRES